MLVQAKGVLQLANAREMVSSYLDVVNECSVLLSLALVEGGLRGALLRVWLRFAGNAVHGIGDAFFGLVESGLARVRGEALLGLGAEIFSSCVRHCLFVEWLILEL